jgi:hypothetical protein
MRFVEIADKSRFYATIRRVLKPAGGIYDVVAGATLTTNCS